MPGLIEHRCSIGERGGFVTRLRRGTYAPHIAEHVALELQNMIGHDVGYGKTRGGDARGEYTLVVEHEHSGVGLRAVALALETVQHAFAGTLQAVEHAVTELAAIARTADVPPLYQHVTGAITGRAGRHETRDALVRHGLPDESLIVDVSPAYILQAGLPFSRAEFAIVLDAAPADVPERYRELDRARKLVSVMTDGLWRRGLLVCPATEWEIQDYARDADRRVAVFATDDDITARDRKRAVASAWVEHGRIALEGFDTTEDAGELDVTSPAAPQVSAALTAFALRSLFPEVLANDAPAH
jgi:cyanophycin synthetase